MDPQTLIEAIDHTARQSDRHLFVALLVVAFSAVAILGRWLAGQYNRLLNQWREDKATMQKQLGQLHAERLAASENYAKELRDIQRMHSDDAKDLLRSYAELMTKNAEALGGIQRALSELQHSLVMARSYPPVVPHPAS